MPPRSSPPPTRLRPGRGGRKAGARQAPSPSPHDRDLIPICGLAAVTALFDAAPGRVERLFFEPRLAGELAGPRRAMAAARKPYREVAADELARIAGTVRHGGVVAITHPRPLLPIDPNEAAGWARDGRPLLILDGIGNPHNLGAVIRSAAYFGVARVVLAARPDQALPSPASYRVAEGALDRVALYRANLPEAIGALKRGYRVVGTALGRGVALREFRSDRPVALVLGNEETGLSPATLALCDATVTIPGRGTVQSLNVAAAAAILLYALTSA